MIGLRGYSKQALPTHVKVSDEGLERVRVTKARSRIDFGAHNLSVGKNEDRGSMFLDHQSQGMPHIASFAVFDGHNGSVAASACSQDFASNTVSRLKKMRSYVPTAPAPSDEDVRDLTMCESIRLTCLEMDQNIQFSHRSGCTLNALFLDRLDDGSIRAYCANVGDSKCAIFTKADMLAAAVPANESGSQETPATTKASTSFVYAMSVDHKLGLRRESERVRNRAPLEWQPLPSDVIEGHRVCRRNKITASAAAQESEPDVIAAGYPTAERRVAAGRYVKDCIRHLSSKQRDVADSIELNAIAYKESPYTKMVGALSAAGSVKGE
jgi:hypothetical protein